jgi:hypothetical protein
VADVVADELHIHRDHVGEHRVYDADPRRDLHAVAVIGDLVGFCFSPVAGDEVAPLVFALLELRVGNAEAAIVDLQHRLLVLVDAEDLIRCHSLAPRRDGGGKRDALAR